MHDVRGPHGSKNLALSKSTQNSPKWSKNGLFSRVKSGENRFIRKNFGFGPNWA